MSYGSYSVQNTFIVYLQFWLWHFETKRDSETQNISRPYCEFAELLLGTGAFYIIELLCAKFSPLTHHWERFCRVSYRKLSIFSIFLVISWCKLDPGLFRENLSRVSVIKPEIVEKKTKVYGPRAEPLFYIHPHIHTLLK